MSISAAWNTGRGYSRAGQRIAVKVLSDGRVAFYDIDRMIDGVTLNQFVDPVLGEAIDQKRLRIGLAKDTPRCPRGDIALQPSRVVKPAMQERRRR